QKTEPTGATGEGGRSASPPCTRTHPRPSGPNRSAPRSRSRRAGGSLLGHRQPSCFLPWLEPLDPKAPLGRHDRHAPAVSTTRRHRDVERSCAGTAEGPSPSLAEGEDVRLDAGIEECDLEHAIRYRAGLAHQLIEPWLDQRSPALLVNVQPM